MWGKTWFYDEIIQNDFIHALQSVHDKKDRLIISIFLLTKCCYRYHELSNVFTIQFCQQQAETFESSTISGTEVDEILACNCPRGQTKKIKINSPTLHECHLKTSKMFGEIPYQLLPSPENLINWFLINCLLIKILCLHLFLRISLFFFPPKKNKIQSRIARSIKFVVAHLWVSSSRRATKTNCF